MTAYHIVLFVIAAFYLLVVGTFVIYAFHKGWAPWIRDRLSQVQRVLADVERKEELRDFLPVFQREEITSRRLTFRCQDGITRVFEVSQQLFESVEEQDHGILLFRGDSFIGFEPAKASTDHDDLYKRMVR